MKENLKKYFKNIGKICELSKLKQKNDILSEKNR